jgi:GNAT superfamily N-acetyltransferase
LRPAGPEDAQAIGRVFDAATKLAWTYLGGIADEPMFPPEEWDELARDFAPPNLLLVATDGDDHVVGFIAARVVEGEVFNIFVDPDSAGTGVGRMLLGAAHDALREAGRVEAFLFTHEENERAIAVYEAAGYAPDGTVRETEWRGIQMREPRFVKPL